MVDVTAFCLLRMCCTVWISMSTQYKAKECSYKQQKIIQEHLLSISSNGYHSSYWYSTE